MNPTDERANDHSRRSFIRRTVYVAPVILTLKAVPMFASQGSGHSNDTEIGASAAPPIDGGIEDKVEWYSPDTAASGPRGSSIGNTANPGQLAGRRRRRWWRLWWW